MAGNVLSCVVGLMLATCTAFAAPAGEITRRGQIEVDTPWARASVGTARPGAAYATIRNTGDKPETLTGVSTPAAARADVHEMVREGDVMKMRPVGVLEIPPGGEARLEPGGLHVMLIQLRKALVEGEHVSLTLIFERAGEVTVGAPIGSIGARTPPE